MAPSSGGGGKEAEDMVNVNRGMCDAQSSPGWVMVPPDSSPLSVDNCGLTDDAGGGEQAMDGRPVEDITLGQARRGTDTHTHTEMFNNNLNSEHMYSDGVPAYLLVVGSGWKWVGFRAGVGVRLGLESEER